MTRLAEHDGMAPRTFAPTYAAKVGRTPGKMVELMRLDAACRALLRASLSGRLFVKVRS